VEGSLVVVEHIINQGLVEEVLDKVEASDYQVNSRRNYSPTSRSKLNVPR
jgi:hypothetical protein